MDELNNALEDAEYIQAMLDGVPRPTKALDWDWLTKDELDIRLSSLRQKDQNFDKIDKICQERLGFHLFLKYIRGSDNSIYINALVNFMVCLANLRISPTKLTTSEQIQDIIDTYLVNGSTGHPALTPTPCYLRRVINVEKANAIVQRYSYAREGANNAIRIKGDLLKYILELATSSDSSAPAVNVRVFDALDIVVFRELEGKFYEQFKQSREWFKYCQFCAVAEKKLTPENDFVELRVLGRGAFGHVYACKRASTGKLYAMKVLDKKRVKMKGCENLCKEEREILSNVTSKYVVCLKYALSTLTELYLVLDLMMCGDLRYHLNQRAKFSYEESRYYTARTILGLADLHAQNIVYRDLKPENILMDCNGYTKLSDLGLAAHMPSHGLRKACGTRGYWAPEIFDKNCNKNYFLEVDWFSLGVCVYEFLTGISPFREIADDLLRNNQVVAPLEPSNKSQQQQHHQQQRVKPGPLDKSLFDGLQDRAQLEFEPDYQHISDPVAVDFIQSLLSKNPSKRLGIRGYVELIEHPWFRDFDWDAIDSSCAPYIPSKTTIYSLSQSDIGAFTDEKQSRKLPLTDEDQEHWKDWQFVSQTAYQSEIVEFLHYEEVKGPIQIIHAGIGCCQIS